MDITRISLEGLVNTRDMGGFPTVDGRSVKKCRLIRSGELSAATPEDCHILTKEYGMKTIIDFRTGLERSQRPSPVLEGVENIHIPIIGEKEMGMTREEGSEEEASRSLLTMLKDRGITPEEYMSSLYVDLMKRQDCRKQYAKFFQCLLEQEEGAVLWHCSAGKDRAGMGAALVLEALGVPREMILQDYLMVNEFRKDIIEQELDKVRKHVHKEEIVESMKVMFTVSRRFFEAAFQVIEDTYDSVDTFFKEELSLDAAKRERLRELYLE